MSNPTRTAYLAFRGFEKQLAEDLKTPYVVYDRLFVAEGEAQKTYWAQNIWFNVQSLKINSITHGANALRAIQRSWWPYHIDHSRRLKLIQEKLPRVTNNRLDFGSALPSSPLGSFTLIDHDELLFSGRCSELVPDGAFEFNENKLLPPSRAYLKLWEIFTRLNIRPDAGQKCLELGASPGGWTWVLSDLEADVTAVDRAPLAANISKRMNVSFKKADAFSITPGVIDTPDWIFSDLICYPEKLYQFVSTWKNVYPDISFICTIKFQGDDHYGWVEKFEQIPGSSIIHLYHNKHEFTWVNLAGVRKSLT